MLEHASLSRLRGAWLPSAAALVLAPLASAGLVSPDLQDRHQTVRGFGVTYGGTDANTLAERSTKSLWNSEAFYENYVEDLGATAVRFALDKIALSSTKEFFPWQDKLGPAIPLGADTYENIEKFNFSVKGVGAVGEFVREARGRGDDMTLMASIWSPPHWMKGPQVDIGWGPHTGTKPYFNYYKESAGGSLVDTPENLDQFGRYVTAYLKGFELAYDKPIDVLSIQNEPRFREVYDSALYTPELFAKAVGAVRSSIDAHNAAHPDDVIVTELMGPDDIGMGGKTNPNLANLAFGFIKEVRHDGDAATAVDSYGLHGWNGGGAFEGSDGRIETWRTFRDGRVQPDGRVNYTGVGDGPDLWVTEHSGHAQKWVDPGSSFNGAMGLALEIHEALIGADAAGYFYWQHQDRKNFLSGFTLTADLDPNVPKFAAFKHFAKYVRPGMVRLDAAVLEGGVEDSSAVKVSAYLDEAAGTVTYVLLNVSQAEQEIQLGTLAAGGELVEAAWSVDGVYHQAGTAGSGGWITLQGESLWSVVTTLGTGFVVGPVLVPEPGTAVALLAGAGLLLRRRSA